MPTLTGNAIENALADLGQKGRLQARGGSYAALTRSYVQGPFYDYFRSTASSLGLIQGGNLWRPNYECWQITGLYLALLQIANADTPGAPANALAAAAGTWDFWIDPARNFPAPKNGFFDGHEIAIVFTEFGPDRIDPQNNQLWTPTPFELQNSQSSLF